MNKISKMIGIAGLVMSLNTGCGKEQPTQLTPEQEAEQVIESIKTPGCNGRDYNIAPVVTLIKINDNYKAPADATFIGIAVDPEDEIISYKWDFGDKTENVLVSTEEGSNKQKHRYEKTGDYQVTLKVKDDCGCEGADKEYIKIE
jgi:hypothetical protein